MAVNVDVKKLLEAGAHFGHKTSRWHPKMAPYIHSARGGNHIIDLNKTVEKLNLALGFLTQVASEGKPILLVGTKRQASNIVKTTAEAVSEPYVSNRWLGGMLTNWPTISGRIRNLKDLEAKMASGELVSKYNKLEIQRFQEQIDSMNLLYGGIKNMPQKVGAVFVFDMITNLNAVKEAKRLGLPVVALVDSNADPTLADYPVPCNDDAIKTIQLIADYVKAAIEEGKAKVKTAVSEEK